MSVEELFHVTILSNFARAYDKYSRRYVKKGIPESCFPNRFFLLRRDEIGVGMRKARALLDRTALPGDRMLALQTTERTDALCPNTATGLGRYVERDDIHVDQLFLISEGGEFSPVHVEDAWAESICLLSPRLHAYESLRPRSVSVLPVARACEAACPFCFSRASVSAEREATSLDLRRVRAVFRAGKACGAERAVITGGGEPGLLPLNLLISLVEECARVFPKVVLITNAYFLQKMAERERIAALQTLSEAGLSVLSISRHHHDAVVNARLMQVDSRAEAIAATWAAHREQFPLLRLRWVCVVQQGGVDSEAALAAYLSWAVANQVVEICFKQLYVSTSRESVYHDREANAWSRRHQVPLELVLNFGQRCGWREIRRLPWGAPIVAGEWDGRMIHVAAYTEPNLLWERVHGIARSWNLMASGRCLASLEDRASEVCTDGLPTISGTTGPCG